MIAFTSSVPRRDAVVEQTSRLTTIWDRWFARLETWLASAPMVVGAVSLSGQGATVATTAVPMIVKGGLYRVSIYLRCTRAATTSSSFTLTIGWTDGAVACSWTGTALTGNTTSTLEGDCRAIRCDAGTTVTYAVAYASVGATSAQFAVDVRVEELT